MRAGGRAAAALLGACLAFAPGARANAAIVNYSVSHLGSGVFEYLLSVDNTGGTQPLSGLHVLHGDSIFGLDASSAVGVPAGWSFFAPVPGLVDDLAYFSLSLGMDVPVDASLGGFSFQSLRDPATLGSTDFAVEGIGGSTASQIDLGYARLVPEPSSFALLASALAAVAAAERRRRRGRNRSPSASAERWTAVCP